MQNLNQPPINNSRNEEIKAKQAFTHLKKTISIVIEIKHLTKKTMYFFPMVIVVWVFCGLFIGASMLLFPVKVDIFSIPLFVIPMFITFAIVIFFLVTLFITLKRKNYNLLNSKLDSILKIDGIDFEINKVIQEYKSQTKILLQKHSLKKILEISEQKIVFLKTRLKQFNKNCFEQSENNIAVQKEKIIQVIKKVKAIKATCKAAIILNIVSYVAFIIIIYLHFLTKNNHLPSNNTFSFLDNWIFSLISIYLAVGFLGNVVLLFLLILYLNSISTFEIENKEFKANITSYKKTIKKLAIIGIFVFSFIIFIVIWIISNSKQKFLKNKIGKLKKQQRNK